MLLLSNIIRLNTICFHTVYFPFQCEYKLALSKHWLTSGFALINVLAYLLSCFTAVLVMQKLLLLCEITKDNVNLWNLANNSSSSMEATWKLSFKFQFSNVILLRFWAWLKKIKRSVKMENHMPAFSVYLIFHSCSAGQWTSALEFCSFV